MRTRSSILIWRDFLSFERFRSNGKRAKASSCKNCQTFSMRTRREILNMRAVSSLASFDRASPMACAHGEPKARGDLFLARAEACFFQGPGVARRAGRRPRVDGDDVTRRQNRPRPKSSGTASRDPPRRSCASILTAFRRQVSSPRAARAVSRRVLVKILRFISGRLHVRGFTQAGLSRAQTRERRRDREG